jgi:hypothetical protein
MAGVDDARANHAQKRPPLIFWWMAIPEDPSRYRDDPDSDDEREHRSVGRRMNMEKRAGCGANDQRDKHTAQSAVLFAG